MCTIPLRFKYRNIWHDFLAILGPDKIFDMIDNIGASMTIYLDTPYLHSWYLPNTNLIRNIYIAQCEHPFTITVLHQPTNIYRIKISDCGTCIILVYTTAIWASSFIEIINQIRCEMLWCCNSVKVKSKISWMKPFQTPY